jgi:hypothetical protein
VISAARIASSDERWFSIRVAFAASSRSATGVPKSYKHHDQGEYLRDHGFSRWVNAEHLHAGQRSDRQDVQQASFLECRDAFARKNDGQYGDEN